MLPGYRPVTSSFVELSRLPQCLGEGVGKRAFLHGTRRAFDIVFHPHERHLDRLLTFRVDVEDHVTCSRVAILRLADGAGVDGVTNSPSTCLILDGTVKRLVRVAETHPRSEERRVGK